MSNGRSTSPISVPSSNDRPRRASLASGLGFPDHLQRPVNQANATAPQAGHMANAAANAQANHSRRLSITTLGLSGSPTQTSPFAGRSFRHGSISSSVGSTPANFEDAVAEDNENGPSSATPNSPFARRMSFGAQALRDARGASIGNGIYPSSRPSDAGGRRFASTSSNSTVHRSSGPFDASTSQALPENESSNASWCLIGEGFNWSEALRTRAERTSSIGGVSPSAPQSQQISNAGQSSHHQRAASIASIEQPVQEMPKQPKQNKPDFFQEKILRGDFMD